ncbi:MAG: TonB-dependent siderophore receptor [Cyanobacteria bacterium J06635_15]
MEKWLPGLSLLTLMTVVSGQGANAQALTDQFSSELEDVGAVATETITQPIVSRSAVFDGGFDGEPSRTERSRRSPSPPPPLPPSPPASLAPARQPTTTVTDWLAQIEAALVQITGVRLETTEAGLQVILETADGELTAPTTTVSGNALIAEIPNAVLTGEAFEQFEPAEGIALVRVTELPGDRVRVAITGTDAAPAVEVNAAATALTLTAVPGIAQAVEGDEALQIVVTGEEGSRYYEPTATTATRTDTPLRDIPQSIQVIPQAVLEDQGVTNLDDALRNASGVTPSRSNNDGTGLRFIVRGFENASVLRDGFRLTFGASGAISAQDLSNIEQIEVLKGPAAILFGVTEPGGVINLVTEQPLSEPFYEFGFRGGSRGILNPSIDISGPLTEDGRLLYRLNASYTNEGYYRDFDTNIERFFVAPVVSWQISDRTDLSVYLEYVNEERPADFGLVAIGNEVADIPLDRALGEPGDFSENETLRTGYTFEHRFNDSLTLRNAFSYYRVDFDSLNTSAFGFLGFNEATGDLTRFTIFLGEDDPPDETFDLQTNLVAEFNTGDIGHTLLVGVDLFRRNSGTVLRSNIFAPTLLNVFNPVYGNVSDQNPGDFPIAFSDVSRTDALGIYLQDQVAVLDNLNLLLGVRYDTFNQNTTNNPSFFVPTASQSTRSDDAFSPRVGVVYQPIEEVSLFASYSRSFSPNTVTTAAGDILEPESGEQFEIGAKAELLAGQLAVSLAYFDVTLQNVATPDPLFPDSFIATGEQRSQGVELDVIGEIVPGWNLVANYAYTDARITDDNSGLEGNLLFNVPEHNVNLWTTYDIQDGPLEGLGFGLGLNYASERLGDNANSFGLDSYFLTNAAISYQRDNWQIGFNIRNLFDVDYIRSGGNSRTQRIDPGEGFTLIGSFSIEF